MPPLISISAHNIYDFDNYIAYKDLKKFASYIKLEARRA